MRCFFAVEPDERARAKLEGVLADARATLGDAADAFRWVQAKNIHITLHFLGNVELPRVGQLTELLTRGLQEPAFRAMTGDLGRFPSSGPPKVLWLGLSAGVHELRRVHRELAGPVEEAGLPVDDRPFTPHLTLARARDRDRSRTRHVRWPPAIQPEPIEWLVTHVTLMQSDLAGPAPEYRRVASIPLGG
jgi:2'-5' RNA ligase